MLSLSFEAFKNAPQDISEEYLVKIVEEVYKDYKIEDSESFRDAIQQYQLSQNNRNMIFDSRLKEDKQGVSRQAKYETVPAIPVCFKDEVLSLKPSERRWFREDIDKELEDLIHHIVWEVSLEHSLYISPLIFTSHEIEKSPLRVSPIVKNIEEEGVKV
ncbi:MAG: hypothetical protein HZA13_06325 [Nitrospirae bacterium]|nr:hypothetical protein [Nitrospirota bacterium]